VTAALAYTTDIETFEDGLDGMDRAPRQLQLATADMVASGLQGAHLTHTTSPVREGWLELRAPSNGATNGVVFPEPRPSFVSGIRWTRRPIIRTMYLH
jgi:hypothetical protein